MSGFRQPTFLALKLCGDSNKFASLTWTFPVAGAADLKLGVPGQFQQTLTSGVNWSAFELDPIAVQGNYSFGVAKGMRISVTRPKQWWVDSTHNLIPGRVIVFVPSTGDVFVFGPRETVLASLIGANAEPLELDNVTLQVNIPINAKIQVWFEADCSNGAVAANSSAVTVQLDNFNFQTV